MGRQSRIKNERRSNSQAGWASFAPSVTRQVMGEARLSMTRADMESIQEMVSTASPAAHAHFAAWDAEGVGVTMETAGYDIANLSSHAIQRARRAGPFLGVVFTTVDILLGDWDVRLRVVQERPGGAVTAQIAEARKRVRDEAHEAEFTFLGTMAKAGVHIVAFTLDGGAVEINKPGSTANF